MKKIINIIFIISFCVPVLSQEKSLDYYISAGLQNNPLFKDYNNQKLSNLIDSLKILAGYKPQVNGVSTNFYAPSYKNWGYDNAITNGVNFAQQVVATQRLVSKENLSNQHEAIRLLNESIDISGKVTEQDLKKSITAQFITAFGSGQQYQFNKEVLDLLKKEELILKRMTEKGIYRQTDYLSFLVTIQQQELLISQYNLQFQNEVAVLNYLCGLRDTSFVQLKKPDLQIAVLPEAESSVFYRQFIVDSLKFKNNIAQIEYNYKPKVNLYADGGYLSSFAEQAYKNFGVSAGVTLTVPIYDGKQKKMQIDKIAISEQTRQGYRDFFKKQYEQNIAQLFQQLHSTQKLIDEANNQIRYTEILIEANRKLLEAGDVRMPDYILAIGNYLTAKNIITQNNINKLQIINQINYWNRK
ncbi:MAG: TolC family protein [Bacteroidota bacterium]|nr:TolC family protein [Bacteroidota bacterium]